MREASKNGSLKGILEYSTLPVVSSDIIGMVTLLFLMLITRVIGGNYVKTSIGMIMNGGIQIELLIYCSSRKYRLIPLTKNRTKIIATVGPSCSDANVLGSMIESGVNCFR